MAREIDIEIVLTGAEGAKKSLEDIGETAGKMVNKFKGDNEKLGEGIDSIGRGVTNLASGFKDLRKVADAAGTSGAASILKFLGPVGAVAAAAYTLYEAFLQISGAAQEAEERTEAMGAAASDLQSKLESLAEKGVIPNTDALRQFTIETIKAQVAKEILEKQFQKITKTYDEVLNAEEFLAKAKERLEKAEKRYQNTNLKTISQQGEVVAAQVRLEKATRAYNKQIVELLPQQKKVNESLASAEKKYKGLEETSAEATLGRVKENIALVTTLKLRDAEIKNDGKLLKAEQIRINALKDSLLLQANRN